MEIKIAVKIFLILAPFAKTFPTTDEKQNVSSKTQEIPNNMGQNIGKMSTAAGKKEDLQYSADYGVQRKQLFKKTGCRALKTWTNLSIEGCGNTIIENNICAGLCSSFAYPFAETLSL